MCVFPELETLTAPRRESRESHGFSLMYPSAGLTLFFFFFFCAGATLVVISTVFFISDWIKLGRTFGLFCLFLSCFGSQVSFLVSNCFILWKSVHKIRMVFKV